ncbi:MAG: phosphosulfolactate synthase, partial [Rikenellaceae bacterium]
LEAGSSYVIAEAREAGNIGIFQKDGSANQELIEAISGAVPMDKVLWEAPQKNQQVWFVKQFGADVNLGNIASNEVISLETIRQGLRGDTFALHLSDELKAITQ